MQWIKRVFGEAARRPGQLQDVQPTLIMALEPRMMFDGAAAATVAEASKPDAAPAKTDAGASADSHADGSATADKTANHDTATDAPAAAATSDQRHEVVFIDSSVPDYQQLVASAKPGTEVVVLDSTRNGLQQMVDYLRGREGIDAIHVIGHGNVGEVGFGSLVLSEANLATYQPLLAQLGRSLSADGDLLIYGCDVGSGAQGSAFVHDLATATGADVAASNDRTGSTALGGDWTLEVTDGKVESASLYGNGEAAGWNHVLPYASFTSSKTFSESAAGSDVDTYTSNGMGRDTFLMDQTGTYTFSGSTQKTAGDNSEVIPVTLGTDAHATGVTLTLSNLGSSGTATLYIESMTGTSYQSFTINATTSPQTFAFTFDPNTSYSIYIGLNSYLVSDYSLTMNVAVTGTTPTLTATGGSHAYTATNSGVDLFSGVVANTNDSGQTFTGATLTVSNVGSSGQDVLNIDGTDIALTNGASSYLENSFGDYSVSISGGVATITLSGLFYSNAEMASMIDAISYRNTNGSSSGSRVVTVTGITDSGTVNNSNTLSLASTVNVSSANAAPVVTASGGMAAFTEGNNVTSTPVVVDSGITVSDADNTTLASASVSISGGFQSGQDVLAFTNNPATMGNITGSYNSGTGVLSLSSAGGTATLAQWQSALRSVTYSNSSDSPNTALRTVSFSANDGTSSGTASSRQVFVTAVNDTPIVTSSGGTTSFTEGNNVTSTPVAIDSGITLSDVDSTTLSTATVSITGGFHSAEDVLAFTNTNATTYGNITASYNSGTGVLSLSSSGSTATLAQWQAALRAVTYSNSSNTPDSSNRTLSFSVNDGASSSVASTKTVSVTAVNDAPTVTASGGSASFVAGDNAASTPVVVDSGLSVGDLDSSSLASATVSITGNFHAGEDILQFSNDGSTMGNIAASYNAATGVLTLTSAGGSATLAQWQAALRSVTYTDSAVTPNNATRTISFKTNDGSSDSSIATRTVTVSDTDQTPILTTSGSGNTFVKGQPAVVIDSGVTVSDLDNTTLASATVAVTGNFHSAEDVLGFTNTSSAMFGNIIASYNAGTGVLTLASAGATATLAQWQNALESVTYSNGGVSPSTATRTISFAVSDGTKTSAAATQTVDILVNPSVQGVSASSANGAYKVGDTVTVTVTFDQAVNVDTSGGAPSLLLETGATDRAATYLSGSGTNTLTFSYTVQAGDQSADLDFASTSALSLNGSTIRNTSGNDAVLTLAAPGTANSLGANKAIIVDGVVPTVSSVSVPANGTYVAGQNLDFTVNASESLVVDTTGGTPRLLVTVGSQQLYADYLSGSGTSALTFRLTVASGELDTDGISVGSSLDLNGGTVRDVAGNNAVTTLNGVASTAGVTVDAIVPTVGSVGVPANGTYVAGQNLDFTVNFSESVNVASGTPRLLVTVGSQQLYADYLSGSGSNALTFRLTVATGELDTDGIALGSSLDLNGATLRDAAGNNADLTLNSVASTSAIKVDAVVPTVDSVSVPANGSYKAGDTLTFTVNTDEAVLVDTTGGTPRLALTIGSSTVYANYVSGSGSNALVFSYQVQVGNNDSNGIAVGTLQANGGTLRDAAGNDATLTLNSVGSTASVLVDTTAPTVSSVSVPADGTYGVGQNLDFTVNYSETVTVDTSGGTPYLDVTLDTGGVAHAVYVSGSGSSALTFRLVVANGQLDRSGLTLGSSVQLNGGSLRDGAGNDAVVTLNSVGSASNVLVDGVPPTVTSIVRVNASPSNASTINFTVTFSEAVAGLDASAFTLVGTGTAGATLNAISTGDSKTYNVQFTNVSGDGTLRLDVNGVASAVIDAGGNALSSGLQGEAYTIDHTAPQVGSVTVPTVGGYKAGDTLTFTVNTDEAVLVDTTGGTPRLALTVGSSTVYADYASGSGSNALVFQYQVQAGDNDADGITVGALQPNGGTLRDAAGNDTNLTLNSVGSTASVLVDTTAPTVSSVGVPANGEYKAGDLLSFTVNASEAVLVDTTGGTPRLALTIGSRTVYADYVSGSGSNALVFQYQVQAGDNDADGITVGALQANGGSLRDAVGNDANQTLNSVGSTASVLVDTTAPTVAGVDVPANGNYKAGDVLEFTVSTREDVLVDSTGGTPRLALNIGGRIVYADYVSGSGSSALLFHYQVQAGDNDADGIQVVGLQANGATLRDAAGNDADPALASVRDTQHVRVDTAAPTAASIVRVDAASSNAGAVNFDVSFSEKVDGLDAASFRLQTSGSVSGQILSVTRINDQTWRVSVGNLAGDGNLGIALRADSRVHDTTGNALQQGMQGPAYTLDHSSPQVAGVQLPADGRYSIGQTLQFTVGYSEAVVVDTSGGVPRIAITLAQGGTAYANYVSGSGTNQLVFAYTVQAGQNDNDGLVLGNQVLANGGRLTDVLGNAASLALGNLPATNGLLVQGSVSEGDPQHRAEQGLQVPTPAGTGTNSVAPPPVVQMHGGLPVLGQPPLLDTRNVGQAQSNLSSLFRDSPVQSQLALVFSNSGSSSGVGNAGGVGFLGFGGGDGGVFASSTLSSVFDAARQGSDEALSAFDHRGGNVFGGLHGAFAAPGLGQQLHEMNQREQRQVADLAKALGELGQERPAS